MNGPTDSRLSLLPQLVDPVGRLLALHALSPARYPVLLESRAADTPGGRFSILMTGPGERLCLDASGKLAGPHATSGFLASLDQWFGTEVRRATPAPWPMAGGWFLYLGYELAAEIEPCLRLPESPLPVVALAWRMHGLVVHDHQTGITAALAEYDASRLAAQVLADLSRIEWPASISPVTARAAIEEDDPAQYLRACRQALLHIAAGDVYQANLARAWRTQLAAGTTAAQLYGTLRDTNPGAFSGIADLGSLALVSSSPERLLRVRGREVDTRPIAGTRPRIAGQDPAMIAELAANAKERAEHVMLIDLERNDLGRLCEPGSVQVDEFMAVESYAHVHHIVSNVCGTLREDVTPGAIIRALFPGGTITGCPKVRCMQLIGDLEGSGRGAYTGAMGYLGDDGSMDLNILIRTLVLQDGMLELRAGAGIVADSDPLRELAETRAKALGVLRAIGAGA